jgi:hypothetical protein
MTQHNTAVFRILGTAHVATAIVLLPTTLFLGYLTVLVVTPALVWLAILGIRLWNPKTGLRMVLCRTHLVLGPIAIFLVMFGIYALRAAQRSAEAGGGLLGAFGLIPIVMGLLAGCLAIGSLLISYFTAFE